MINDFGDDFGVRDKYINLPNISNIHVSQGATTDSTFMDGYTFSRIIRMGSYSRPYAHVHQ